jgi:hypothetical protein
MCFTLRCNVAYLYIKVAYLSMDMQVAAETTDLVQHLWSQAFQSYIVTSMHVGLTTIGCFCLVYVVRCMFVLALCLQRGQRFHGEWLAVCRPYCVLHCRVW